MKKIIYSIIVILTIVIALLVAESFLRWIKPIYFCDMVSQYQYDSKLGVVTKPSFKKDILTDHIIEVFTNDLGSRNYLNKDELLQYEKIVFCVGDSYTQGIGNLTDESYPFYLNLLLNRNENVYEKKFAVFNLGLAAYGSIQSLLVCKSYIEKIGKNPDAVIYLISHNDADDDIKFKSGYIHRHIISGSPYYFHIIVTLNNALERTQLYIRTKRFLSPILRKKPYSVNKIQTIKADYHDKTISRQFDPRQLPGLIDMISFSEKNGIKLVISYSDYKSNKYDVIKKFAVENNILFSDYKRDIKRMNTIFNELPVYNRHSGGHFRSWVNFIIAENFTTVLKNN